MFINGLVSLVAWRCVITVMSKVSKLCLKNVKNSPVFGQPCIDHQNLVSLTEPNWIEVQQVDPVTRAFIGHARQYHDLIGCSETRTVRAQSVLNRCIPTLSSRTLIHVMRTSLHLWISLRWFVYFMSAGWAGLYTVVENEMYAISGYRSFRRSAIRLLWRPPRYSGRIPEDINTPLAGAMHSYPTQIWPIIFVTRYAFSSTIGVRSVLISPLHRAS